LKYSNKVYAGAHKVYTTHRTNCAVCLIRVHWHFQAQHTYTSGTGIIYSNYHTQIITKSKKKQKKNKLSLATWRALKKCNAYSTLVFVDISSIH